MVLCLAHQLAAVLYTLSLCKATGLGLGNPQAEPWALASHYHGSGQPGHLDGWLGDCEADKALVKYISHVGPRFQQELEELKPYWKLNALQITNPEGDVIPPGMPQEKSMEGSLVEINVILKHNFITMSRVESFSVLLRKSCIMVLRIGYCKVTEAYKAFKGGMLSATQLETSGSLSRDKSGSEETMSSSGIEPGCEEETSHTCKAQSGGLDRGGTKKLK
ncbi:hypothetical protein IW261DRAFT_1424950 [Armillaria novae-zelandiae]|uniref:Uncharacterized protein n=1 Tax=Armillaria novae-zelandiae TaxID=153914 RepID=A0AA39NTX9_9AGAR|nr:hypothetical protein IW261DRAFT_1424950 [Armillaria novae-zelandiae]